MPTIATAVYHKLLGHSITAQVFVERDITSNAEAETKGVASGCPFANSASNGASAPHPVPTTLTQDSPQIRRRKLFLQGYLKRLFLDPGRFHFWQYLDRVA